MIRVPEMDLLSQARSVVQADASARDLIAVWLDVPSDRIGVQLDYSQVSPEAVSLARAAQKQARAAERTAAQAALDLAQGCAGAGVPGVEPS